MTQRRGFLIGLGAGVAGTLAAGRGWDRLFKNKARPPWALEHSNGSFWMDSAGYDAHPPKPPLNARQHKTDVLIIGGGFTGMSTAWHLRELRPDAEITLIDGARCGFGASGRNGGWCMGANYNAMATRPDLAGAAREFMQAGVGIVRGLEDQGIACDFTPARQLYVVRTPEDAGLLEGKIAGVAAVDIPVQPLDRSALAARYHTDDFAAGAFFEDGSASIHPGKLALGLRNRLIDSPVRMFEGTKVLSIEGGGRPRATTEYGVIEASEIVLATNAYSCAVGEFSDRYVPMISNVIATEPLSAAQLDAIGFRQGEQLSMGDSGEGYFYAILTSDNRMLIGGGHPTHNYGGALHNGNLRSETDYLEDYLTGRLWPQLEGVTITHRWGGNTCITRDFLFSLGRHPERENVYYALGYSGEGVSTSFAAGRTLAELMADVDSPLTRSPFVGRELGYVPGEPLLSPLLRIMT
ncbi:MAG: FAD-dependent oxidoreductase [Pseudomonadales bacterium]